MRMPRLLPGSRLSHFEILEKLGEGGMGVVYKARDLRLNRPVAIKVLPEQAAGSTDRQARFEREAKAASALNHPNIVTVYEVDQADDVTFIVMEFIDGKTLGNVIARKGLPLTEALKYSLQIADALAAAHGIGIVHRDIKPANVMITGTGLVKVLDFGLAKLAASVNASTPESSATVTMQSDPGVIVGTTAYMSPEQAQGLAIDARSDIFAFGTLLYEMLTGKQPFAGETKLSTLSAIVNQEPLPVQQLAKGLPAELDRIVARCLRKDPARRFQHMADLHVALAELKEESDSGRLLGAPALKNPRQRTTRFAAAVALVVTASLGLWLVRRLTMPAPLPRIMPVTTYPGSQSSPSFSPDATQVAFCWKGGAGGNGNIYVKMLRETNALRLTTNPDGDEYPAWSPDGRVIAFRRLGAHGGIYTTSPLGGAEQKLTDFATLGPIAWTPDGKWLAVASADRASRGMFLIAVDPGGGEPRRMSTPKSAATDLAPAISRDGHHLAYASCTGLPCDLFVQDLDSAYAPKGSPRRITGQPISLVGGLAWTLDGESLIADGTLGSNNLSYLWRFAARGQASPQRIELAGPRAAEPSIAATGNRMAFQTFRADYDIWRYRLGAAAEPFIVSSLTEYNAQFSPDGSKIAFESDRTGDASEIWIAQADGSHIVQLTSRLGRHQGTPRWSPDGRWIVFDSAAQDGNLDIYVIDASGGRPRRITSWPSNEAIGSWSRDGKWIYFRSNHGGRREIWRTPFAGGTPVQVTTHGGDAAFESADGKTLFYVKSTEPGLFAQPSSGGAERKLLDRVVDRAFVPVKDGIYYIGGQGEDRKWPLQFFEFSNNTSRLLTRIEGSPFLGLDVSPDGQTILFSQSLSFGMNLMLMENFR